MFFSPKRILIAFVIPFLAGCPSTQMSPLSSESNLNSLDKDEKLLWKKADEAEKKLCEHVAVLESTEDISRYLNDIIQTISQDIDSSLKPRIYLLPDPVPNAYCLANGSIFVTTGLLNLLENEAQLATVLAHEFYHFKNRHHLCQMHKVKNDRVTGLLTGLVVAVAVGEATGTTTTGIATSVSDTWVISSFSSFSQDLETEADQSGLIKVLQLGYSPEESIRALEQLESFEQKHFSANSTASYSTHPRTSARIAFYKKQLELPETQRSITGNKIAAEKYTRIVFPAMCETIRLSIKVKWYDAADASLQRCLALNPDCPDVYFLFGELHRHRAKRNDDPSASIEFYQRAIQLDSKYAPSYREIGLLYRYQGDGQKSQDYLRKYVSLAPTNPDVPLIRSYLNDYTLKEAP